MNLLRLCCLLTWIVWIMNSYQKHWKALDNAIIARLQPLSAQLLKLSLWQNHSGQLSRQMNVDNGRMTSHTTPALPSFSGVSSENLGTMRAPVAIASNSISTPPTHLTAGSSFTNSKWFASSSNPHWHITRLAPESCIEGIHHDLNALEKDTLQVIEAI